MTSLQSAIAGNRTLLRQELKAGNRQKAEFLAGIIVGQRILNNEIPIKLPPIPEHLK